MQTIFQVIPVVPVIQLIGIIHIVRVACNVLLPNTYTNKAKLYASMTITDILTFVLYLYVYTDKHQLAPNAANAANAFPLQLLYTSYYVKYMYAMLYDELHRSIIIHHVCVLSSLTACLFYESQCRNILVTFSLLTSMSTPFFSCSKLLNTTTEPFMKTKVAPLCLVMFLISFICGRIVLYPILLIKPALLITGLSPLVYAQANIVVVFMYALQYYWLFGIVRILKKCIYKT